MAEVQGAMPSHDVQAVQAVQPPETTAQPLFQRVPPKPLVGTNYGYGKGSLIITSYRFAKHDATPLILVSGVYPDGRVAGVNLHYLPYPKLVETIKKYSGSAIYNWSSIKADLVLVKCFRTYRKDGLSQERVLNKQVLSQILNEARTVDPNEQAAIREKMTTMVRQAVNQRADQVARDSRLNALQATGTLKPIAPISGQPATIPGQKPV